MQQFEFKTQCEAVCRPGRFTLLSGHGLSVVYVWYHIRLTCAVRTSDHDLLWNVSSVLCATHTTDIYSYHSGLLWIELCFRLDRVVVVHVWSSVLIVSEYRVCSIRSLVCIVKGMEPHPNSTSPDPHFCMLYVMPYWQQHTLQTSALIPQISPDHSVLWLGDPFRNGLDTRHSDGEYARIGGWYEVVEWHKVSGYVRLCLV